LSEVSVQQHDKHFNLFFEARIAGQQVCGNRQEIRQAQILNLRDVTQAIDATYIAGINEPS
jgi:hypothetical protein